MTEPQHALGPLAGRVALVTGASSGLGRATAVALAQAGADVALLARGQHDLEQVAAEVEWAGRRGLVLVADLADAQALTGAVARVVEAFGRVDVLVNAAGTDVPAPPCVATRKAQTAAADGTGLRPARKYGHSTSPRGAPPARSPASEAGGRVGVCLGLYDDPHRRSLTRGGHSSSRLAPTGPYPVVPWTNLTAGTCASRSVRSPPLTVP